MTDRSFILNLACPDTRGIVYAVSGWLVERRCNILESAQFGDPDTGLFAMRIRFQADGNERDSEQLEQEFRPLACRFGMSWNLRDHAHRPRALIMVSRQDHCLHDLLYRYRVGELGIEIPYVISNHTDVGDLVASHDIRFLYWPAELENRCRWDEELLRIVRDEKIEFVVLARYMQILSASVCEHLPARIINIHHSFLPGFKGASPYAQAYERGVKVIGATAHYVTTDLDEGPIIEQDVVRVDHSMPAEELTAVGRDIEKIVLARAVRYQAEQRIVLNGKKTIVFR
jgi:formyltetrahydrofolate deformylase